MAGIIAAFPPNPQCDEGILALETDTEGHLIYIFFSKKQGQELLERYRKLCNKTWRRRVLRDIRRSRAPEKSEKDTLCIMGCSARTIAGAVETFMRTGSASISGNPDRYTDWSFSTPNNTQSALDTRDGVTVLQRGRTHHLYVFYSKEQARSIVAEHMVGAASKQHYHRTIDNSILTETSDVEMIHHEGPSAATIGQMLYLHANRHTYGL